MADEDEAPGRVGRGGEGSDCNTEGVIGVGEGGIVGGL